MLEKYYQLSASSGFAGEDETRIIKVIGEKENISRYIDDCIDEMYSNAVENAVNNLQDEYEDEDELYEEVADYVSNSCDELTQEEFEEEVKGIECDYNRTINNLTIYVWYR